mmetsp:Transcript_40896/g.119420  ORF Transcript_40896/g.119420 Transcript_40896/m.119420 type:complete len:80 (-) Transcript_40896:85-324(-)
MRANGFNLQFVVTALLDGDLSAIASGSDACAPRSPAAQGAPEPQEMDLGDSRGSKRSRPGEDPRPGEQHRSENVFKEPP